MSFLNELIVPKPECTTIQVFPAHVQYLVFNYFLKKELIV